jgi:L,D-transpeptidase YcbB
LLAKNCNFVIRAFFIFLLLSGPYLFADLIGPKPSKSSTPMSSLVTSEICRILSDKSLSFEPDGELVKFYKDGQCRPVWSNENTIDTQAIYLIYSIRDGSKDGLDIYSPNYHFSKIVELLSFIKPDSLVKNDPVVLAQLDILLTDAYLTLGKHLNNGLVPYELIERDWKNAKHTSVDMKLRLRQALRDKTVKESLEQLIPSSHEYQQLRTIMQKYLKIEESGGWKEIESIGTNDEGDDQYSFDDLKERLRAEGDLAADEHSHEAYEDALKNFQSRHGINADGIVGPKTLLKMNISVADKITVIRLNLEKWRWMPEEKGIYISVNIPDFTLSVMDENTRVLNMKAILGKEARQTPMFSAFMKYIVVNPYWRIPSTILREDIIPKVQKDIRYLKKERIRIFKAGDYTGKREINPRTINWKKVNANAFPYLLRQDPGRKNVLGRLKFMFPNSYDIYIHDTPVKSLFDKEERLFSSGCIRIQEPLVLFRYLMNNDGNEGYENITDLIASGANKTIMLRYPIKVRIDYWTVWADEKRMAQFRDDIYGHDNDLREILGWQ